MPQVSIVLPTYNRADTVLRAIESIRRQTFQSWELLVVDDGSTDGTADRIRGLDPRLRVLSQTNQGITGARNAGLAASRGEFIAFLDSDDEWMPYHLDLCVGFLRAHPDEIFVSGEFWEVFGPTDVSNHYLGDIRDGYAAVAKRLGVTSLDLPAGESDPYLRVYQTREPIGDWGRRFIEGTPHAERAALYRGDIFEHWRWGYLLAMQPTVMRRQALDKVGFYDPSYKNLSDFGMLALLCKHFRANYLSLPLAVKHEFTEGGRRPKESHLATGKHRIVAAREELRWFEQFFWTNGRNDGELALLRATKQLYLARVALRRGLKKEAVGLLDEVSRGAGHVLWEARSLAALVKRVPSGILSGIAGTFVFDKVMRRKLVRQSRRRDERPSER